MSHSRSKLLSDLWPRTGLGCYSPFREDELIKGGEVNIMERRYVFYLCHTAKKAVIKSASLLAIRITAD